MTRAVVHCDGASQPGALGREASADQLEIWSRGPKARLTLRIQPISDALKGTVSGRAEDLARIAAYVYWADQMVSRGGKTDVHGDRWRREFVISAPVRDPDFWNSSQVLEPLESVLSFASDDVWKFAFSKADFEEQLYLDTDPLAPRQDPDCVALFSGGTDSLCAAVEAFAESGSRPVLVSHHSTSFVDHRQHELVSHLRQRLPGWFFPRTSILVNKTQAREKESTQRTRSFLFSCLAGGIASALGLSRVLLADNGVVSLNLPINGQLIGSLASRSTHPKFISLCNELMRIVLPHAPQLENPLWNRTRSEALGALKQIGAPELLQETNSCSNTRGLPNVTPHCGVCSQCIDRRFAALAADLEVHDLGDRYRTSIFTGALDGDALTMAESYVRFARTVNEISEQDLFLEYPQLQDCILADDPQPHVTAGELARLVKRHAREVVGILEDQVAQARADLVQQKLPSTCLITLAVDRTKTTSGSNAQPEVELTAEEEAEFSGHRFKSRHVVQVTGGTERRKSNVMKIGLHEVILPDAQFKLFLRLVVGLVEAGDGWVDLGTPRSGGGMAGEGIMEAEEIHQAVARLRGRIGPALIDLKATQFVEVSRKRIRLSTHRRYVTVERDRLLTHPDDVVRRLAQRLPPGSLKLSAPVPAPA